MTSEEALKQLGTSTQDAVAKVLRMFTPDGVEEGDVTVVPPGSPPLYGLTFPSVGTNVSYVDGVSGGNVFVITRAGARKLASAMMGMDPAEIEDAELSELELSAVGEAMNQMMAAAAGATSTVLGEEVDIAPPITKILMSTDEADGFMEESPYATSASLSVFGEPCRLIQLVPAAFVMRMTRALQWMEGVAVDEIMVESTGSSSTLTSGASIRQVPVRLSVRLGCARLPVGDAVRLWNGAVIELDQPADAPLEILVNGYRFALGRLVLVDGTDWAIRIERVVAEPAAQETTVQGGVK
jgi:flagellar motor switch protein FliN/FliY